MVRTYYQHFLLDPLVRKLQLARFATPTQITFFSMLTGVVSAIAIAFSLPVMAISLLILSGLLDTLDGTIARAQASASNQGALMDIMSDRIVEAAVVIGLFAYNPSERSVLCLLMLASILLCVTSFLTVAIFNENASNKSFHYSVGLMERFEAFVFFIAMILFPKYFSVLSILFSVLVLYTAGYRLYEFSQE